jgi:hypothetical protein
MMNIREAWSIAVNTAPERRSDVVAGQPLVEWYERVSDSSAKARVLQAVEVLLLEGDAFQQELAATFVSCVPIPSDLANRLAELYASRGWDSDHRLSALLGGRNDLTPDARATLRRVYLQDPLRQHKLLSVALQEDEDGRVWKECLGRARLLQRPEEFASAYWDWPRDRRPEFFDIVCGRGEDLVRRTARSLPGWHRRQLLSQCGQAPFDPRPAARRSGDAIPVDELLVLLENQRCSLWFILPAPLHYPEHRDRSVFFRHASESRLAAAFPWFRGKRDDDRFCDAWYRRKPPQLISMACWTREQFQQQLRAQGGNSGLVPLEYLEPFSRVPRFVLRADLPTGKPAE